jgi:hypothetical protein
MAMEIVIPLCVTAERLSSAAPAQNEVTGSGVPDQNSTRAWE